MNTSLVFVDRREFFEKLHAHFFALIEKICRDFFDVVFCAHRFVVEEERFHRDEVDHPFETAFRCRLGSGQELHWRGVFRASIRRL